MHDDAQPVRPPDTGVAAEDAEACWMGWVAKGAMAMRAEQTAASATRIGIFPSEQSTYVMDAFGSKTVADSGNTVSSVIG